MRAYGFAGSRVLALQMHPFKLELYEGGRLVAVANGDNKFYFEHHRSVRVRVRARVRVRVRARVRV